jgi:hypothetical protein
MYPFYPPAFGRSEEKGGIKFRNVIFILLFLAYLCWQKKRGDICLQKNYYYFKPKHAKKKKHLASIFP